MSAIIFLIFSLLITLSLHFTVAQIGVDYGREGDGLPSPSQVVVLYQQYGIQLMRIYDTNPETLQAVSGSNIELTVGILNQDLEGIAASQANADDWVRANILGYPDVKFRHIVVGNEVSPAQAETAQYVPFVLQAMQNVHTAISNNNLGIKVTTAIGTNVLEDNSSYPPENGVFRSDVAPYLNPIVRFLMDTDAPLFANIYPFFAYMANPAIDIRYALLDPSYPGETMPNGVVYKNIFYALFDAVNAALEKSAGLMASELGADAIKAPPFVKGGETGWSSGGGRGASVDNAKMYANNLIQAVKTGTPKRPNEPIETYIFAMFDENRKPGETEKNFGLFTPEGQPKYDVNFS